MHNIAGYDVTENIFEDNRHSIVRAIRLKDNVRVVLKITNEQLGMTSDSKQLEHEYVILTKLLGVKGVIKAKDFIRERHLSFIELEDNGLQSLSKYLDQGKMSLIEFLDFAIQLVNIVKNIHQKEIIHKDINPSNILWNKVSQELIVLDFEIASTHKNDYVNLKNVLCGSPYYISPEQTGRTNSHIDYRTDLYSMGVIFYQAVTGQLPFESDDMLELVHSHIAKIAIPPHRINSEIPIVLSKIIMKLLEKQPEDRYQTEDCIIEDLNHCLTNLQYNKKDLNFEIAQFDVINCFNISHKLYGRKKEEQILLKTLDEVANGKTAITEVYGPSGIGKTALIHYMYELILTKRGYFIEGKFEQFNIQMPHLALTQCLRDFAKQLASASQEERDQWRTVILEAVGENGQILTNIAPELEWIIGKQKPVIALTGLALEHRFLYIIEQFFQVLGSKEHPLVLFWDDMQWVDAISFKIIDILLNSAKLGYIYIILSYRDEQKNIVDSMRSLCDRIPFSTEHNILSLRPLTFDDTLTMLTDSVPLPPKQLQQLSKICHEKTCGNPFYINEFLRGLAEEKLIYLDKKTDAWAIDLDKVKKKTITFNVVKIVLQRMKKMPIETRKLLGKAACIGYKFELNVLARLCNQEEELTAKMLSPALKENYLLPLSEKCIYAEETDQSDAIYGFGHDKLWEVATNLLATDEKKLIHYKIALILIDVNNQSNQKVYTVHEIAHHFNEGLEHIKDHERLMVIRINLESSKQAYLALAYKQALYYLNNAISLVDESDWISDYQLILDLYTEAIRVQAITGDLKELDLLSKIAIDHTESLWDEIPIYRVKALYYEANHLPEKTVEHGIWLLNKLNYVLPLHPKKVDLIKSALKSKLISLKVPVENISNLPQMTNSYSQVIMQIFSDILLSAAQTNQKLFGLICSEIYYLTLHDGLSEMAPMGCVGWGVLQAGIFKNYEVAYRYGRVGLQIGKKYHYQKIMPHATLIFGGFINHTKNPYKSNLDLLAESHDTALEVGNVEFIAMTSFVTAIQAFYMGQKLTVVKHKIKEAIKLSNFLSQAYQINYVLLHKEIVDDFIDDKRDTITLLSDSKKSSEDELHEFRQRKDQIGINFLFTLKLMLSVYFNDYERALIFAEQIRKKMKNMMSHVLVPIYLFYDAYALISYYQTSSRLKKIKMRHKIKNHIKILQRFSRGSPHNYAAKYHLILAKWCEVNNAYEKASNNFQLAIDFADVNKLLSDQALANEAASEFYSQYHQEKIASMYLQQAYACYQVWGAKSKIKQLEQKHSWLSRQNEQTVIQKTSVKMTSTKIDSKSLDYISTLKASIAVANEIKLPKLITRLLAILTENIGAQRSLLFLKHENSLYAVGEYDAQAGLVHLLPMSPINEREQELPVALVQYVATSYQTVHIDDVWEDSQFSRDSYILKNGVKSVLCLPLIYQHSLMGILYFEHRLIAGVFTKERLEFLKMLSSQIVISLQNAELYASFERFVPHKFLQLLGKKNPSAIKLGDNVQRTMTILFADLRGFTSLAEDINVTTLFNLLNSFLGKMEPIIAIHEGFIDKYIGDAIMALFPRSALDAVDAAIQMCLALAEFNALADYQLDVGIGISTGMSMLGTVGSSQRMDGSIISDAVNTASRIEHLNKIYGSSILISEETRVQLPDDHALKLRCIDKLILRGHSKQSVLWEVLNYLPEHLLSNRMLTMSTFNQALDDYLHGKFKEAGDKFLKCIELDPSDNVAKYHYKNCLKKLKS